MKKVLTCRILKMITKTIVIPNRYQHYNILLLDEHETFLLDDN